MEDQDNGMNKLHIDQPTMITVGDWHIDSNLTLDEIGMYVYITIHSKSGLLTDELVCNRFNLTQDEYYKIARSIESKGFLKLEVS